MPVGRRVVVTGLGAVTPLGNSVPEFWANVQAGKSGIGPITLFDPQQLPSRIAGEVRGFDVAALVGKKDARKMDRFSQLAFAAAREAVEDSKLRIDDANRHDIGVFMGSGIGGIMTIEQQHRLLLAQGPDRISPFFIPMLIGNIATGLISIDLKVHGPTQTAVSACASSNNAIGDAFRVIQAGEAEAMVCGGSEAPLTPLAVGGFCAMRALSTANDAPASASRPFDRARDGFVIAEGGGALVLEELRFAQRRGASIYGEIIGYGRSSDAYHMAAPDPDAHGVKLALKRALQDAAITPDDVDYINAHATSTPLGDTAEAQAITSVFGERAKTLPVSSNKSMFGHALGAAGALEGICTVLTIRDGIIPPTINYRNVDPACPIDCVPNVARKAKVDIALSDAFGFGGHNAILVFRRYAEAG
ncbi:MAG: beta-ketoacyl-ACP synthase II [Candidatus Eremiobacteraeota bacterium]|nr:beta-ketoacyl-ACP synthase II [Candidatus Eremiobacteraeota bacterium]MBC5827162.1 beta-ketoacyl-ACP synthase II [Candidatus Eremiobacteraeota bacterium]